ncbi:GntR family transcriptional regulator [Microvirga lupini]|uniref:GntR family transcriptional regulator n=1 Tax=Microvirga lupini TaxID=420324 RepID=UPI00161D11A9|nr:GntR family transcriptional regulator [Microvirga lupini]
MVDAVEPLKARRIYLLLRERILNGALEPGSRLPGELSIAAEYGVSRVTVRRALDTLAIDGLIDRRPGSGTFVREGNSVQPIVADLSNVLSHLVEMGRRTSVRLLSFAYVNPSESVAGALGLEPGERAQRSIRVRLIDGAPFSYLVTHVPERIGVTYSEADLASMPLLGLLERSGIVVDEASQSIGATLAGPDVADALGLEIGSPLLSLTRVVWDPSGQGVEHLHALYRPDRYSFHMDLVRTGAVGARRWNPVVKPTTARPELQKYKAKGPKSLKPKPRPVRVSTQRRTST